MSSSMVRIGTNEHETLRQLSKKTSRPMASLLEEAILDLKRKFVLEATSSAYRALRTNKRAWAKYVAEHEEWDAASLADLGNG